MSKFEEFLRTPKVGLLAVILIRGDFKKSSTDRWRRSVSCVDLLVKLSKFTKLQLFSLKMALSDNFCDLKVKFRKRSNDNNYCLSMTQDSESESSELIISIEKSDLFERVSPSRAPHSIKCPSCCVKILIVNIKI